MPRIIVGVIALVCVSVCGILATFSNFEMIDKVNDKLSDTENFAQLGWYLSKMRKLSREHRTFCPDGRLLLRVRILTAIMFVCVFIAARGCGFFAQ
jgi:hypothetical protein